MSKHSTFINTFNQLVSDATCKGVLHLNTQDKKYLGNTITIKGKPVINFGSCSYLGLEFHPEMIRAGQQALSDFGTTFSASRAYVSCGLYDELETLFDKIFDAHTLVAPTTTLGHMGLIPIVIGNNDVVILDHQVHNSVQTAVSLVKPRGVKVELIRHNRMDLLEERINILKAKYEKIWYMSDGVYSMYGDKTPVDKIYDLLDKYPQFNYYVDDAHGMSVFGNKGQGHVLGSKPIHERMIFTTSLAKAFGTGGAVLAFSNAEMKQKVRNCASCLVTSGPMQPAALGAAIKAAKMHLNGEIAKMQEDLQENIKYTNLLIKKYGLPNIAESDGPVFFIGVSLPKLGYNLIRRMLDDGFYLNHGVFPAVPMKNTGVRFTITRLHTFEQIEKMVSRMAYHYPKALKEVGFTMKKVYAAFKIPSPEQVLLDASVQSLVNSSALKVEHNNTILDVNQKEWDSLLGNRGTFNWNGLNFLEHSFQKNLLPESNWEFDYIIIRDTDGKPILATFLTSALNKDDMLSPKEISAQIEIERKNDPYHLCSKTLFVGCMLTEGNHLYIDRSSPLWKDALHLLFEKMSELQEQYGASMVSIRDLPDGDAEMDAIMTDNGYFKTHMPENHIIEGMNFSNADEFVAGLSRRSRNHIRHDVLKHVDKYEIEVVDGADSDTIKCWYNLYLNVKNRSLDLNTFALPYRLFEKMALNKYWDITVLRLKPEFDTENIRKPIAVMFCYKVGTTYNPILLGLDYTYQKEYKSYRQVLYQVIMRAKGLGCNRINLGFGATVEKRKFGAQVNMPVAYMQAKDNYNLKVLGTMTRVSINN